MAEKKRIGDILKELGLIDDFQLEAALSHQRNWGGRLGAVLVDLGFVREEDIAKAIAGHLRIPCANLFEPPIPPAVFKVIKPDIAKKYTIMPVKKDGGSILIAMADPLDIKSLDEIRFITGLSIKPALAMESEIRDAIRKYYDGEQIVRTQRAPVFQHSSGSEPMEIIRESDPCAAPQPPAVHPDGRGEDGVQKDLTNFKLHLEALISLLIEKGLIGRDELLRMIDHKKIGL